MHRIWIYATAVLGGIVANACSGESSIAPEKSESSAIEIIDITDRSSSSEQSSSSFSRPTKTTLFFSNKVEIKSSSSKVAESSSSSKPAPKSSSSSAKSSSSEPPASSASEESSSSAPKSSASLRFYDCEQYDCVTMEYLNPDVSYGEMLDKRDNQVYRTLVISNHVWTAQNMNYEIESDENDEINSWCYDNEPENCKRFGRLYTWEAAKKVCPEGWHLPTEDEWQELIAEHSCDIVRKDGNPPVYRCAGTTLKAIDSWGNGLENTNEYGFSIVAAGIVNSETFMNKGITGYLWASTSQYESLATLVIFEYNEDYTRFVLTKPNSGLSVRCVKGAAE
ncbi:conserved domain protein [Fibrobacter succinogenes subsp. succinogenes S85]|uniref:Conserved domain protein n=1 Tax=Fibrobacter succinogenes (strain ATCC 19169 / S85) TaxID=59374 RepID=C9RQ45_FIBSS|nr:fibrobacter succinogenes major paralogous domain-containing protein [Fibrobacter succinogenes]ACX74722.1 hypothetical protein Fisuc_1117 [Fibrobacter succinogenes subsp. succinogenes S85]ADL25083.1 conserved domain protein [Fibrobacter succinogenes subsp. succinogenes S85]